MREDIYPNEELFRKQVKELEHQGDWSSPPILHELKAKAKKLGLFNLFLPFDSAKLAGYTDSAALTNRQYAELCEIMGTSHHVEFAAQVCNCASPDTGNMEVLARFGNQEQKDKWLVPLLQGDIRSCFAMTEPDQASSDASNISIDIAKRGEEYVINGRKWYITGAGAKECKIIILMGKTSPKASPYKQQSMLLVPMNTAGISLVRPMQVFGDDDAPKGHMELSFKDVVVPVSALILGEGRGFEISQSRLGPGRIHHCMRLIGQSERALSAMCLRAGTRTAFSKKLNEFDTVLQDIAKSRAEIDQARFLVQEAASAMDTLGNKHQYTRKLLSLVKAVVPKMSQEVVDRAIQVHGAMGLSQDTFLPSAWLSARSLRIADGPDEVHWRTAAILEVQSQKDSDVYKHAPLTFRAKL